MKINHIKLEKLYSAMRKEDVLKTERDDKKQDCLEKDSLVLSSMAKGYCEIGGVVTMATDEVMKATPSEKLLQLKNEILQGTYHVSTDEIVDAMVEGAKHNSGRGAK